jgi:hypothetical protein
MDKVRAFRYYSSIPDIKGCEHRYIEETIKQDREKFRPAPIANPFLDDFVTEAMASADGEGGRATATGVIGSMQGILGAL